MIGKTILDVTREYSKVPDNQFSDVLYGTVIKLNPLTIKISDKLILNEKNLILSAFVQETWIDIPTTNGVEPGEDAGTDGVFMHRHHIVGETELANDGQGSDHKHTIDIYTKYDLPKIRLWRGLELNDVVYLLRIARGQSYYVLQRVEGITNES